MITPSYPPTFGLIGNQLPLQLVSDAYRWEEGAAAVEDIEFTAVPGDEDLLTFNLDAGAGTFVIVFYTSPPGTSMWQFTRDDGLSVQDFIDEYFIPDLDKNIYLRDRYSFSRVGTDRVRFSAKAEGPAYNFTLNASAFADTARITTGLLPVLLSNMAIYLKLEYKSATASAWQSRVYTAATNAGSTQFKVDKLLSLEDVPRPLIAFGSDGVSDVSASLLQYRFRFAELLTGDQNLATKLASSPSFFALPGGVSRYDWLDLDLDFDRAWLTHQHFPLELHPHQRAYFTYWHRGSATTGKLMAQLEYDDLSTEEVELQPSFSLAQRGIYSIAAHPALAQAQADPEKTLQAYAIFMEESGGTKSESLRLEIMPGTPLDLLQLLYRNSWGFFEIAAFCGEQEERISASGELVDLDLPPNYGATDRWRVVRNARANWSILARTGYKTAQELAVWRDLLRSEDVLLLRPQRYEAVRLEAAQEMPIRSSKLAGDLNSLSLVISPQSPEKYYSDGRYTV